MMDDEKLIEEKHQESLKTFSDDVIQILKCDNLGVVWPRCEDRNAEFGRLLHAIALHRTRMFETIGDDDLAESYFASEDFAEAISSLKLWKEVTESGKVSEVDPELVASHTGAVVASFQISDFPINVTRTWCEHCPDFHLTFVIACESVLLDPGGAPDELQFYPFNMAENLMGFIQRCHEVIHPQV